MATKQRPPHLSFILNGQLDYNTLAANLYQRFAQTGAGDDIQQVILIVEEAVTSLPNDHEERAPWMRNLSDH
jgi:hypothetical protein